MAIDEKKLLADIEELPLIHGRYDHENGNIVFIRGCETMYKTIKKLIENQPKLSLEKFQATKTSDKWVPCSKELPKKSGIYYVSGKWKDRPEEVWLCEFLYLDFMGSGGWCNSASRPIVQAWMEKPDPYKEDE